MMKCLKEMKPMKEQDYAKLEVTEFQLFSNSQFFAILMEQNQRCLVENRSSRD